jgi:RimJ/RimL family protein N-acetyltransferase
MHSDKGPLKKIKMFRVRKMKDFPHVRNNATMYFQPFLEHWARKSLLVKDRVVIAVTDHLGMVGFAIYNREAKIGTILCRNAEMTEMMRRYMGCKDFFTEEKHTMKASKLASFHSMISSRNKEKDVYNIFETHTVYKLYPLPVVNFDTDLVRPMKKDDLKEVSILAKKIYRTRSKNWIRSSFEAGDIGFVAEMDGRIVGFCFAEICGEWGRIHTLSVHKEYRGRGIAKELFNARLEAMRQMGVVAVVDEIADWNLASIRIATVAGFKPVGKMYVETARNRRIKKDIIRR